MFDHVGHGLVGARVVGWTREDLELVDRHRALAVCGAEAVGARVTTTDDHDVLARSGDGRFVDVALLHTVAEGEVLHRLVDPTKFSPGNGEVTPRRRATGEDNRLELGEQLLHADVDADVRVHAELGALATHLVEPALEVTLLHLELGDAVAEQAADAIGALEHDDVVTGACELLRGGQPRRP